MSEDYIKLCFSSREALDFPVGSSAGDFYITKKQVGTWNANTGVWDYQLQFDAYYWLWANKILRYIIPGVNSAMETSFSLTAGIQTHASVILRNLAFLGIKYDGSDFGASRDDTVSDEAKLIQYENLSILGGIQAIAEAFNCEWWVRDNLIYFGKCENKGSNAPQFTFKSGLNTSSISFQNAKSEAPNRLYVYGSDRNLPTNYRKVDGTDTIGGVVAKRLMLPEDTPYLQTREDIPESEIVEKVITLDSVYPRTDLTVSEIETYTSNGEDEEGNETTETFYRLKYGTSFLFSESYILPDEELHIVFQSGKLNGMDFGARFNPKGLNEKNEDGSWNPEAQMIEIVANEDYGRKLPDTILKPEEDDEFILYGWDSTKMENLGLIAKAEAELLEEGQKVLAEYTKDLSTCTCPMAWDYMKPLFAENKQPNPGDAVTIMDTAHFGQGGRKSRIIGYEYKLDKPYAECTYTCGENVSVKRLDSIEKKIEGLAKSGQKVQMQNSLDFLSKRYSDRTPYALTVGGKLTVEDALESLGFMSGMNGFGWGVDQRGNADFESIRVRSFMEIAELITNRLSAIEGDQILTESDTIEEVTPWADGVTFTLRLHKKWDTYFTAQIEHNVCKGIFNNITSNITPGTGQTSLHGAVYYTSWFRVLTVNAAANTIDVILYPDDEVPVGKNFPPCAMMRFARWGNSGDPENERYAMRQQCLYLSSTEGRITKLFHVTKPIIDEGNVAAVFGTLPEWLTGYDPDIKPGTQGVYSHTIVSQKLRNIKYKGLPDPTLRFRGAFDPTADYYAGDTVRTETNDYEQSIVEWYGCQWLCSKTGTHNPPSWKSTDWTFYMGDPTFRVELIGGPPTVNPKKFKFTLFVIATKANQDVTADILPQDVVWTRYSEDDNGDQRVMSDNIWATSRGGSGMDIELTEADINAASGLPKVCIFTAQVTLRDGTVQTLQKTIGFRR